MSKVDFDEFKKIAKSMNVKDVSEEEYGKHYDERLTMKTMLSRIRYYRKPDTKKGASGPVEEKTVMGYALGGRDFIAPNWDPPVTLDNTKTQRIAILTKDGEWLDLGNRGKFSGAHGRLHELKLTKKQDAKNWNIATPNPTEEKWRPDKFKDWVDPSYLFTVIDPEDDSAVKYKRFCVKGNIATIFSIPDYDKRDKAKEEDDEDNMRAMYPIDFYGGAPVCEIIMDAGNSRRVKFIFGSKKRGEPHVGLTDWNTDACPTIDELRASFDEHTVGIIGQYYKWDTWNDRDSGEDILQMVFFAHAIVGLAPEGEEDKLPEPVKDEAKARTEQLFAAIEEVKKRVGPAGLTVDAVKAKLGDNGPEDYLINAAIRKSKEAPAEEAPKKEGNNSDRVYRLIRMESMDGPITLEYIFAELQRYEIYENDADKIITELLDAGKLTEPSLGKIQAV